MTTTNLRPILASWKISEVLRQHPELIDVLVDLSPAFRKLRNPMLRRVQTRLVTVAQAASIAGLDPAELTRTLNQAAGITPTPEKAMPSNGTSAPDRTSAEAPAWVETAPVAAELDVRPMLERGEEPFRAIMAASREVPPGAVLRLIASFEPLPLFDAMARKGFAHWAIRRGDDLWEVRFFNGKAHASSEPETPPDATPDVDWDAEPTAEVTIDVSELVPPEPMVKILQALETLPDDSRLLVHHVRRPMHLYDRLDEMGYAHETRELGPGQVEVMIQKGVPARRSS